MSKNNLAGEMLVGDMVAEFLQCCGVSTAFGVVSVHNIPMLDAIGRRNAIRFIGTRNEAGAGHMADAAARSTDTLSAFFSSTGPGAANACGALVEARFAGAPLLHITGQTASGNIDRKQGTVHDVYDQLGMLEATSKSAYRIRSAETALGTLIRAATDALSPPMGPVSIEIPIDIQRQTITRPMELDHLTLPIPTPRTASDAELSAMAEMIATAKRPVLWTGSGARQSRSAVQAMVELGIPLVTSWNGRGVMPEDNPMALGGLGTSPQAIAFYEEVDLMIVAGSRMRGHETNDMSAKLPARMIHIDIDPEAKGRTYGSELFACADAGATLGALASRLAGRMQVAGDHASRFTDMKTEGRRAYLEYLGPYAPFPAAVRKAMPANSVFCRDVTLNNTTWGNRLFEMDNHTNNVYPIGAAIGPGLSMGIGAALASGRKVVAMTGDGGFQMNVSEIWTAQQERADVVIMVMDDRGYGVIKHIQNTLYGERNYFADPSGPELEGLAKLVGMPFERISNTDQIEEVLSRAIAVDGPVLLEVDMTAIGEFPPYFQPPPYAQKG